jgi:hypothetical protein
MDELFGKIVKSAIKINDKVYTGHRHSDIFQDLIAQGFPREELCKVDQDWQQGFVTESGRYLPRCQALGYARYIGQVKEIEGSVLTSEDLW